MDIPAILRAENASGGGDYIQICNKKMMATLKTSFYSSFHQHYNWVNKVLMWLCLLGGKLSYLIFPQCVVLLTVVFQSLIPNLFTVDNLSVSIPYFGLLIVATITGTLGNILIIATVVYTKALRTTGNMFICNLSIADLCVTAFVDIFNIISVVEGEQWFRQRPGVCDMVGIICLTACFCSLYSIGAVSFNRYVHICHFEYYRVIFSAKNTVLMCVLLWVVAFLLEMPNIIGWGDHTFDKKTLTCLWDRTHSYSYTLFVAIVGITIPLFIISISYIKIFIHVRNTKRRVMQADIVNKASNKEKVVNRSRTNSMKLARTLFVIFITFAVCWAPYAIVIVADRYDTYPQEVHMFAILLAHVNSSCNCILYGITNKQFRQGYASILGFTRCCPKQFDSHHVTSELDKGTVMETVTDKTIRHSEMTAMASQHTN